MNTYHHVEIGCKNYIYKMMNVPFHMQLTCTRSGGWELWEMPSRSANLQKETRVGGEYEDAPFEIRHGDMIVCSNRFIVPVQPEYFNLTDNRDLSLGLLKLATLWTGSNNELLVYFEEDQLPAYESLCAYVKRFEGLWWGGYFWKADLQEGYRTINNVYTARFVLSEPKTDGN